MIIYEYGNHSGPHILLIHGMWMCHEMLLPFVSGFEKDYHIIAPDLTGHGEDLGQFFSAKDEAQQIESWLVNRGIRDIEAIIDFGWVGKRRDAYIYKGLQ